MLQQAGPRSTRLVSGMQMAPDFLLLTQFLFLDMITRLILPAMTSWLRPLFLPEPPPRLLVATVGPASQAWPFPTMGKAEAITSFWQPRTRIPGRIASVLRPI